MGVWSYLVCLITTLFDIDLNGLHEIACACCVREAQFGSKRHGSHYGQIKTYFEPCARIIESFLKRSQIQVTNIYV